MFTLVHSSVPAGQKETPVPVTVYGKHKPLGAWQGPVELPEQGAHTSEGGEDSASDPHTNAPTGQREREASAYATQPSPGVERAQGEEEEHVDGQRQLE